MVTSTDVVSSAASAINPSNGSNSCPQPAQRQRVNRVRPSMPRLVGRRPKFILLISCFACLFFLFRSPSNNNFNLTSHKDPDPTTPPPRILLVSSFYHSSHSKHSDYAYTRWLERFLGQISTDIYFFTSPDLESLILSSSRPASFPLYLNTSFPTPFSIPPLLNLSSVYSTQQHNLDHEKWRHSPDVYAIWNGKPYFVTQAIQNLERQGKVYDYVFWNDAGSFRDEHWYKMWPDPRRVEQVWTEAKRLQGQSRGTGTSRDMVFFPVGGSPWFAHRWWKEHHGPLDVEFSEGSFFGGSPTAMHWFSQTFYAYHNHYLSRSFFIGKDQSIFNSLFLLFPDKFITMYFGDVPGMDIDLFGGCCWKWWYYHFWFGDEEGGRKVREMWRGMLEDVKEGKGRLKTWKAKLETWVIWWRAWRKGELEVPSRERLAPVVSMRSLLGRRFGRAWTPPERYVHVDLNH